MVSQDQDLVDADRIREAIKVIVRDEEHEQVMVGNLILMAEVTGPSGQVELLTLHNTEITPWNELGMLHDRIANINQGHFELGVIEDED